MKIKLDDLKNASAILDREGQIVRCNSAWRSQFPLRNLLRQLTHQRSRAQFRRLLRALLRGQSQDCDCEVCWSDDLWLRATARALSESEDHFLVSLEDISESVRLRDRNRLFQTLVERLPAPIFFMDPGSGETLYANAALLKQIQLSTREELQPSYHGPLFDAKGVETLLGRLSESEALTLESTQRTALGRRFPVELSILRMGPASRRMLAVVSRDISETRRQLAALGLAGSRLQAILTSVSVAIVTFTLEGLVSSWNPAAEKIYGWTAEEINLKPSPFLEPYLSETISQVVEERATRTFQATRTCRAGHTVELSLSLSPLLNVDGAVIGLLEVSEDVTDRVKQDLLRNNRRLLEGREAERLSLARELHDGPLQDLLAMGFLLAEMQSQLAAPAEPPPDEGSLGRLQAEILRIARQLRSVTSRLRPAGLEEFGLEAALEGLLARLSRDFTQVPTTQLNLELLPELTSAQQLCLLRIVQEAFHNCLRHSQAKNVVISLRRQNGQAQLEICDDGCGFDWPAHRSDGQPDEHYGLVGMEERTLLSGGSFDIQSSRDEGTRIRVSLPLAGDLLARRLGLGLEQVEG